MMHELLDNLAIELPSWAFGNSGTRFKVFLPLADASGHTGERQRNAA